jgi:DNA-binding MarR family transcriptional regulator
MRMLAVESSFFLHAVADSLGMGTTDFACLIVLLVDGPVSAGGLAERTGLTTGAITGLVDRLERAGWVERVSDPSDRRRVIVEAVTARADAMRPFIEPMLRDAAGVEATFAATELDTILGFVDQSVDMLARQVRRLRGYDSPGEDALDDAARPGVTRVPLEGVVHGRLEVRSTGVDLTVTVADIGDSLCVVDFGEFPATVTVHDGRVDVSRSARGRWRARDRTGQIVLNRDVVWDVSLRDGASRVDIDLRGCVLSSLAIAGGASTTELRLPRPPGRVPIRLSGGASRVRATRPAGVPVTARVRGGAVSFKVDGAVLNAKGGSSGFGREVAAGEGVYEFEIRGGASSVEVVEEG